MLDLLGLAKLGSRGFFCMLYAMQQFYRHILLLAVLGSITDVDVDF